MAPPMRSLGEGWNMEKVSFAGKCLRVHSPSTCVPAYREEGFSFSKRVSNSEMRFIQQLSFMANLSAVLDPFVIFFFVSEWNCSSLQCIWYRSQIFAFSLAREDDWRLHEIVTCYSIPSEMLLPTFFSFFLSPLPHSTAVMAVGVRPRDNQSVRARPWTTNYYMGSCTNTTYTPRSEERHESPERCRLCCRFFFQWYVCACIGI